MPKRQNNNKCSVYIWNELVGELILIKEKIYFKYKNNFDLEISPIELPVSKNQFDFSDLKFQYGLSGVFSDSLPDSFGMKIIDDYFHDNYPAFSPNIIDKLLFVGEVNFGALSYKPAYGSAKENNIPIELSKIKQHKKNILENKTYSSVKEAAAVYRSFSPAGGAREKIILNYNEKNNSFSVGANINNDIPILLKLDESKKSNDGRNGIIEYIYSLTARKAGIDFPDTYLFKDENGFSHFAVKRFDVNRDGEKLHKHTLSGLLNIDKSKRIDYIEFMEIAKNQLFVSQKDIVEMYRRMVFNYVFNNNDDHIKNHSFLMGKDGNWKISPAYDVTFNNVIAHRNMMLSINYKKSSDVVMDDFKVIADKFGISNFKEIILEVQSTKEYFSDLVIKMIPAEFDYDISLYLDINEIIDSDIINGYIDEKDVPADAGVDLGLDV